MTRLALSRSVSPTLIGNEAKYVNECLDTNWISSAGRFINAFEAEFAAKCDAAYGVACANGTVALHLALAAMGIGPGDEVIIPTFTMIATINAVTYTGARPVLVDSEPQTWNMDIDQITDKVNEKTKAIIPVHTYGHPVDMDPLMDLAEKHGIWVLEDAAEAHGAVYKGTHAGGLGHAATFSFYANKNITTGEGGMVTTNNKDLANLACNLRDHAFSEERHFWHKYLGFQLSYDQPAGGHRPGRRRRSCTSWLIAVAEMPPCTPNCCAISPVLLPPPEAAHCKNVFWMYSVMVEDEFGMSRDDLRHFLAREGIETRTFFIPLHFQPIYFETFKGQRFPVAETLCKRGFYYPSASSLTEREIRYIVAATRRAYNLNH